MKSNCTINTIDFLKVKTVDCLVQLINGVLKIIGKLLFTFDAHRQYRNICMFKLGNIGDIICAVPAMYKVHNKYPDAKITLLTNGGKNVNALPILQDTKWIDEVIVYDRKDISLRDLKKTRENFAFLKSYDLLINFPDMGAAFFEQLKKMGFFKFVGVRRATPFYITQIDLFTKTLFRCKSFPNEVKRVINGLPFDTDDKVEFHIGISDDDKFFVQQELAKEGIEGSKKILAISFNGKGEAKKWINSNFHEIARRWVENDGVVVFVGGRAEFEEAERIIGDLPRDRVFNFAGRFTILQSMQLLKSVKALLTIDTGTAHMAAAMDVPCVEVFTSHNYPNSWRAYGDKVQVISCPQPCSPCFSVKCRYGHPAPCMKAITVDMVWDGVKNYAKVK